VKEFSRFFHTRSDSNIVEIRAYLFGLMQSKRGSKNIERMEEDVAEFNYQAVHNTISHSPWQHRPLMDEIARRADELLGGAPRSRLVIDDTGIQKKGTSSVGVERQYNGRLGKVENCQIAVCTSLASGQQSTLTDIRLYLPESWANDPKRCKKVGIPEDQREFHTKTALALQSVRHQRQLGVRFDCVSMDSGYGSNPALLHALDNDGETFVAEVHCRQQIWTQAPWPHQQSSRRTKPLLRPKASHPGERVDELCAARAETDWRRLKVRDSDQGSTEVNYLSQRIWVVEGEQQKLWWLLAWENPDEASNNGSKPRAPRRHYALSNASADEDPRQLIIDALGRNVIERNFRDAKSEVGMADYQTRGWLAWQHHMSLVMLAMLFLLQERMHTPAPATAEGPVQITSGDITFILERLLPRRGQGACDEEEIRRMLEQRIEKRVKDQVRRRIKTRETRPPLWPDEIPPT
jgi:SRSO17 transposase